MPGGTRHADTRQPPAVSDLVSTMPHIGDLYTVRQAARELGISASTVQRRIAAGEIRAEKLGDGQTSTYVITRAELDRFQGERVSA